MKALSLHQPWASLLAHGAKRIETRGWPTDYRGALLIHAAKKWDGHLRDLCLTEPFRSTLRGIGLPVPPAGHSWTSDDIQLARTGWGLPFGALVGRVTVADCFRIDRRVWSPPTPTELAFGDFTDGRFAWVCEAATPFAVPVPCVGRQGLFDVPNPSAPQPAQRSGRVTVVKVNNLSSAAERARVCYVGRGFAGWPASRWGNANRTPCPDAYRAELLARPDLDALLTGLWEACDHGRKPLGCWCCDWDGTGETPGCHAAVLAEQLNKRFAAKAGPA